MRFQAAILLFLLPWRLTALTHEEAGVLDFTIATTGHGPLTEGSLVALEESGACLITSDAGAETRGSSCYLACRSPQDGSLLWRRNVCSSATDQGFNVLYDRVNGGLFTIDESSIIRAWDAKDGSLLWEKELPQEESYAMLQMDANGQVLVASRSKVQVLDANNGDLVSSRGGSLPRDKRRPQLSLECQGRQIDFSNENTIDLALHPGDQVHDTRLLSCYDDSSADVLIMSTRGVSTFASCTRTACEVVWSNHEGLSSVSQAILLDSSHKLKHGQVDNLLNLQSRLAAQWKRITSSSSLPTSQSNNHLFGFIKSAVLLSPTSRAVYGMDTIGDRRAAISFVVNLPLEEGTRHVMVHGAPNAPDGANGIHGGTLSKHVLIVSHSAEELHWMCLDGTSGTVLAQRSSIPLSSPVLQVLPVSTPAASDVCQQSAMLVLKDASILAMPDAEQVRESVKSALSATPNGFYAHTVDRDQALLETFLISSIDAKMIRTGLASFPNERIVRVAYPIRDEVITSPTVALGDDSVLLKYINPHLMAIVTMRDASETKSSLTRALEATSNEAKGKQARKPVGVTADDGSTATTAPDEPNLFVNIVDSVSGQVLYRVSHANALSQPLPTVAISENWLYYTFTNAKTRRGELGVLSLYEGMIDSKGLTAFTKPDQADSFSSLDARESKPLVLAKVYSLARPITALGVTTTQRGISNHRLVLASVDGQVYNIDRKTLEPRRPVGELKDPEKKEGLMQYSEFVSMISLMSLSYNQTIEQVKGIVTAPTDLESQSLILAFGGPDIFFTRTSPSRGFDLLPESFSRPLLSLLVMVLLVVLVAVKQRVASKTRLSGWA